MPNMSAFMGYHLLRNFHQLSDAFLSINLIEIIINNINIHLVLCTLDLLNLITLTQYFIKSEGQLIDSITTLTTSKMKSSIINS